MEEWIKEFDRRQERMNKTFDRIDANLKVATSHIWMAAAFVIFSIAGVVLIALAHAP